MLKSLPSLECFNTQAEAGRFTFYTHGRLSQQLGLQHQLAYLCHYFADHRYSLEIDSYSLGGPRALVLTSLKVFIKDLWALGQLYRVFSFIGLAVTLILVSFIYQRYLGSGMKVKEKIHERN